MVLQGRYAGKKAVIVKNYDEGTLASVRTRARVRPRDVPPQGDEEDAQEEAGQAPCVKTFIKTVNYNHLMPTRYSLDVDLKATVTDALENATKKTAARKEAKKVLEERSRRARAGGSLPASPSNYHETRRRDVVMRLF